MDEARLTGPEGTRFRVLECVKLVRPRRKRTDVGFWTVLMVLLLFLLGARLVIGLDKLQALGAAAACWLPVFLLWWNRFAVQEQQRLERAVRRFEDRFPREGDERATALDGLVTMALGEEEEYRTEAHLLLVELGAEQLLAPTPVVLPAASGKAVAPKLYGTGPEKPAALPPAAEPVQGESVLPPELQEAADAQPPLELVDTPAPEPSKAPPPSHPERFDYIPLEPHGPAEIRENGDGEETSGRDRDR